MSNDGFRETVLPNVDKQPAEQLHPPSQLADASLVAGIPLQADTARSSLQDLAVVEAPVLPNPELDAVSLAMKARETAYIEGFPAGAKRDGLKVRYEDQRTTRASIQAEQAAFLAKAGINVTQMQGQIGVTTEREGVQIKPTLETQSQRLVDELFLSHKASNNPEKHVLVRDQTSFFITLLRQAQKEGSIDPNVTDQELFQLVSENVVALAMQDRAASENLLGDHGVRHITYDINTALKVAEVMEQKYAPVTTMDKLLLEQAILYHDIGYKMAPVREAINSEGIRGQDAGHNVLSSKYVRERLTDQNDVWNKIFGKDPANLDIPHSGILFHDRDAQKSPGIEFVLQPERGGMAEIRRKNIESIIRVADNTHAFEDKLPELIYRFPETLKYMRLMKTAGEVGDQAAFLDIRRELATKIKEQETISQDDKDALMIAIMGKDNEDGVDPAKGIQANGYLRTVGRICGNKPEFSMDDKGRLKISVKESDMHLEIMKLFGMPGYEQLTKFIADLRGDGKPVDPNATEIDAGNLVFAIQKGSATTTDYSERIKQVEQNDPIFVEYANKDIVDSLKQLLLQRSLDLLNSDKISPESFEEIVGPFITRGGGVEVKDNVSQEIQRLIEKRKLLFTSYRQTQAAKI